VLAAIRMAVVASRMVLVIAGFCFCVTAAQRPFALPYSLNV
jgi:hypothetical protein